MTEGGRSQVSAYQVSQLQVGIFLLPEPKDISATSIIEFKSDTTLSQDISQEVFNSVEIDSLSLLSADKSYSSTTEIDFDINEMLSLDNSLIGREKDSVESQISVEQVSGGQVGYFEQIPPATSIKLQSDGRLSLRSIIEGKTSKVEFDSDGITGVDVYIDSETSEVEFTSEGTVGVDKDVFTSNQLKLITSGDLELIILFTNESCLVGVKNTESNLVGVDSIESDVIGIIKKCDLI